MTSRKPKRPSAEKAHKNCHFGQHYTGRGFNPDTETMEATYRMTCQEWEDRALRKRRGV